MKGLLFLANILLTVAAVLLTVHLVKSSSAPTVSDEGALAASEFRPPSKRKAARRPNVNRDVRRADVIWEKNLFHPQRVFEEFVEPEKPEIEEEKVNEVFELVSIARVQDRACASIIYRQERPKPKRGRRTPARRTAKARKQPPRKARKDENRKVYRLNDPVGETGYILAKINIDAVLLRKGDHDLPLYINKGDEYSKGRREDAFKQLAKAADAGKKKTARAGQADKAKAAAKKGAPMRRPPPPPPPPAAAEPTQPDGGNRQTRIQDIRKAITDTVGDVRTQRRRDARTRRDDVRRRFIRGASEGWESE